MLEQQRPKRHYGRNIGIGCGALVLLVIILIIGIGVSETGHNLPAANSDTPTAQDTTAPTEQTTQAPTVALKWTTTQSFSGNGSKKTQIFTVPDDWKILWKCDPSSSFGGQYNVIVGVTGSDGSSIDPAAINTICKAGNTGDSTEEHQGGQVYLDIESEGSWSIQVQELK